MSKPHGENVEEPKGGNNSQNPEQPAGEPPNDEKGDAAKDLEALRKLLNTERANRRTLESKLSEHERNAMTDQEKAVAAARDEGRAEALSTAGKRLAAAEFRAAAAGRVDNMDVLLDVIDASKFIGADGEPDLVAIKELVDKLAAGKKAENPEHNDDKSKMPAGLTFPGGVRDNANNGAGADWLRMSATGK